MDLLARLDRLPVSRPHYLLLALCGFGFAFDAMDVAVVAFSIPSLRTEFGLSLQQAGLIGGLTQLGLMIGAIGAGYLGDRFGRLGLMMYSLVFYCAFTLVGALAPTFEIFLGARFVAGLGLGAEAAIIITYMSEFLPSRRRGLFLGLLTAFFAFGSIFAALLGRFVVASFDDGWRYAQMIAVAPVILVLIWRRVLSETPRYLLHSGREQEAEQVVADLERRAATATGGPLPDVPTRPAEDAPTAATAATVEPRRGIAFVLGRHMIRRTAVVWVLWLVFQAVSSGFNVWIPTLLVERGLTIQTSFTYSIIIYGAQLPGYVTAAVIGEWIDRKFAIAAMLLGSAAGALVLSRATSDAVLVTGGVMLSFFVQGATAAIYTYTPEQYPTWVRATGDGLASAVGRIGSIGSPILIGYAAATIGFVGIFSTMTALLVFAVLTVLLLGTRTAGKSLEALSAEGGLRDNPTGGEAARDVRDA